MWLALGPGTYGNGSYTSDTTDTPPDGQSPFAGQVATGLVMGPGNPFGPVGPYDVWLANMAIQTTDGSVHPLFTGGDVIGTIWGACSNTNLTLAKESTQVDSVVGTTYYVDDHLGTASLELSGGGWPVWKGEFAPYGAELDTQATANHYKFTGKENDTESGNDYFKYRYYRPSIGRWLSADPSGLHFASPQNPQTLNLYSYVGNNPLYYTDPLGLSKDCDGGRDPSVVCMVTTAWDWVKSHVGGGSGGGGCPSGATCAAPKHDPQFLVTSTIRPVESDTLMATL